MALSMVIKKPNLPSVIKAQPNGAVDPSLLSVVDRTGLVWEMAHLPARGMRAFHADAKAVGLDIRSTGRGRTLAQQWQIFGGALARYRAVTSGEYSAAPSSNRKFWPFADYTAGSGLPAPGRATVANLLNVTVPDSSYWIKIPFSNGLFPATAAVPGTSNHGFWCADDMQEFVNGVGLNSIRPSTLQWLYANAGRFGFAWELASETWHVHWINGDVVPQAVLDYENGSSEPPEPPDYDEDVAVHLISKSKGQWIWSPGTKPQPLKTPADALAILAATGAKSASVTDDQLDALYIGEAPAGLPHFPV